MSGFVLGFITIIVDSIRIFASSYPSKHSSHYLIASLTLGLSVLSKSVLAWTTCSKKSWPTWQKRPFEVGRVELRMRLPRWRLGGVASRRCRVDWGPQFPWEGRRGLCGPRSILLVVRSRQRSLSNGNFSRSGSWKASGFHFFFLHIF